MSFSHSVISSSNPCSLTKISLRICIIFSLFYKKSSHLISILFWMSLISICAVIIIEINNNNFFLIIIKQKKFVYLFNLNVVKLRNFLINQKKLSIFFEIFCLIMRIKSLNSTGRWKTPARGKVEILLAGGKHLPEANCLNHVFLHDCKYIQNKLIFNIIF